jgi:hypothetical protein
VSQVTDEELAAERLRVGLGHVCTRFEELREFLPEHGLAVLARLTSAADGPWVSELLDELDAILRQEGDVHGVYGGIGRSLTAHGLGLVPSEVVYLCPSRRCARYLWCEDTTDVPVCALTGSELRRERLP